MHSFTMAAGTETTLPGLAACRAAICSKRGARGVSERQRVATRAHSSAHGGMCKKGDRCSSGSPHKLHQLKV